MKYHLLLPLAAALLLPSAMAPAPAEEAALESTSLYAHKPGWQAPRKLAPARKYEARPESARFQKRSQEAPRRRGKPGWGHRAV